MQLLDLEKRELEWVCRHMGHSFDVHMDCYRLLSQTLHIAKVGKLLTAFDDGLIAKYTGMTLDDIDLTITGINNVKGSAVKVFFDLKSGPFDRSADCPRKEEYL